jgi:hypothetical protein
VRVVRRHGVGIAAIVLGLAVVLPLLAPGFVLRYDMVFVPRPHFTANLLGLSRQLPRSVPSALLVAVLSRALTGQVVEKLVFLGIFAGAAYGAARLVPSSRQTARVAGGILYAWNPLTYERLLLGQWALLLGYAVLPWIAWTSLSLRRGQPRAKWALILALAAAVAASPYTGVFGALLALAIVLTPPWPSIRTRQIWANAGVVLGAGLAVNLPWLVPALLHGPVASRPAVAVALFRSRSDSPLGTIGSLVSLGGTWRTDLAPLGRATVAWIPAFVLVATLTVVGWRTLASRWPTGARNGLLVFAALGLALAAAPSFSALRPALAWAEHALPGGGLLRDAQKFVMPLALAEAVGFGLGVERILDASRAVKGRPPPWAIKVVLIALPIALAPTLVWGATGHLVTASYPPSWSRVQHITSVDPEPGAILVLPWQAYMPFGWNEEMPVLQPARLFFSREVVSSTALRVGRVALPEEDAWSTRAAGPATDDGRLGPRLASLGVRYVLLFKDAEWRPLLSKVMGLRSVLDAPDLSLFVSPTVARPVTLHRVAAEPVLAGDAIALAIVAIALSRMLNLSRFDRRYLVLRGGKGVILMRQTYERRAGSRRWQGPARDPGSHKRGETRGAEEQATKSRGADLSEGEGP